MTKFDEAETRWAEILERTEAGWRKTNRELIALLAERDALRAQLDNKLADVTVPASVASVTPQVNKDWDYMANVRDARHWISREPWLAGTWVEKLADALETVIAQRDEARRRTNG